MKTEQTVRMYCKLISKQAKDLSPLSVASPVLVELLGKYSVCDMLKNRMQFKQSYGEDFL